jgi:putative transposase
MIAIEAKLKGRSYQYARLDEAIRTAQFIRNRCLRHWMDNRGVNRNDLQKLCSVLSKDTSTPWSKKLNSQARQAAADRAWQSIARFYDNCKNPTIKKKGYPKFKKYNRCVEYKNTGWLLSPDRKQITFKDGFSAGTFELWTSRDLVWYSSQQIKRVRVIKRTDGYYCQFLVDVERREEHEFTGSVVGIDLGLKEFYTDSNGSTVENPRYLRKSKKSLKRLQRKLSRRHKKPTNKGHRQSNRYHKARVQLAKQHLKVSRQRKDKAIKDALALIQSHDLVIYENLKVSNMVKNHKLAKSISDASWYQFCQWLGYFARIYGVICIAVPPHFTSQDCSNCGTKIEKSLSTRTHNCPHCHTVLDRDHNAAKNILASGLKMLADMMKNTVGHTVINAQGEDDLWLINGDVNHLSQLGELGIDENLESHTIP